MANFKYVFGKIVAKFYVLLERAANYASCMHPPFNGKIIQFTNFFFVTVVVRIFVAVVVRVIITNICNGP